MKRRGLPAMPDRRQPWQIAQGARCCGGTDDMCACQNEDAPWRYGLAPWPVEADELADLRVQVATLTAERDEALMIAEGPSTLKELAAAFLEASHATVTLTRERDTETAIVSRIWQILGNPTYEQLAGRSIYDLIETALSDRDRLSALIRDVALPALADLIEIDRRDALTDPAMTATDEWRAEAFRRAAQAHAKLSGEVG